MTSELDKCINNLFIQSVILKNLMIEFHNDFDADMFDDELLSHPQELRGLKMMKVLPQREGEYFYRFYAVIGIRLLSTDDYKKEPNDNSIEPLLEIKSEFIAQYESSYEFTEEILTEFSNKHIYFHIWPYWREILQSSCARVGIPPFSIAPFRI